MALTLPAAPYPGHDTRFYRVRDPIIASDPAQTGAHWQHLAAGYNLALATLHAGAIASDSWADGQGAGLDSEDWVERLLYTIPPRPSSRHTQVRVVIEVENAVGADVRITTAAGGALVEVPVAGVATIDQLATVDTAGGFDDLVISTQRRVDLISVELNWVDVSGAGWPAAASTITDLRFDDVEPIDDDDYAGEECLSSGRMLELRAAQQHLVARRRGYLSSSAVLGAINGPGRFVARPIRRVVPVPYRGQRIIGRARMANPTAAAKRLWLQLGAGAPGDVTGRRARARIVAIELPAAAPLAWHDISTLRVRDDLEFRAPQELPGWSQIAVYPEDGLKLYAIGLWETT